MAGIAEVDDMLVRLSHILGPRSEQYGEYLTYHDEQLRCHQQDSGAVHASRMGGYAIPLA